MSEPVQITLPMPRLGETMQEGTIAQWLVHPGQGFRRGEALLEVETDKTLVEYPALGDGRLIETLAATGDAVEVGTPIALIETEAAWDGLAAGEADMQPQTPERAPAPLPDAGPATLAPASPRPRATPLARRIARQNDIPLDALTGSGRRGRIEADDVRALIGAARSGTGGDVYFVHGLAGLGANWAAVRARLRPAGIASVAPDLPAHGRNPREANDVADLVDWLAEDLAKQSQPVHLVGHSLGAHVAALAALRDPARVSRLTLIAPAGCGLRIMGRFVQGMAQAPGEGDLAHLMRRLGPKAARLDARSLSAMADELGARRLMALADATVHGDAQRIDTIAPLRALAGVMPITAIFGLDDAIIPRDHAFHMPPLVACHMLEAGHMPHWDAPETVAQIIAAT